MDIAQGLFAFLANPNVAYVFLIVGLISMVLALTAPGTGVAEVAAGLCLILAIIGLAQLPVNIAGIVLIALGMGMFILDIKVQSSLLGLGGALTLGIGSLFLFQPGPQALTVSWWLVALTTAGTGLLFGLGLNRAMHAMRLPSRMDRAALAGAAGVIKSPLSAESRFIGTAQIGGELWTVKSDEPIAEGSEVIVEEIEGVTLKVRAR
jgi:membrane-bound serine protease (ClpP class)